MNKSTLFHAPRAKVARARENLQGLQLEFQRFSESKPYRLRQEKDLETNEYILVYFPIGEIPCNWSVIIGEILFNLRSALDLAIYELTVREQGVPLSKTEFPVFDDKSVFSELKKDGTPTTRSGLYKIRGLSQKTIDCIEASQPYNIRQTGKESVLALLHEMNNIDKHNRLHLCRQMAFKTKIILIRDAPPNYLSMVLDNIGGNLDERAIIARMEISPPFLDDEVYMNADVVIEIFFDKGASSAFSEHQSVVETLQVLIAGVETILLRLENSLT